MARPNRVAKESRRDRAYSAMDRLEQLAKEWSRTACVERRREIAAEYFRWRATLRQSGSVIEATADS
jgi:hypothetical protein